MNVIEAERIVGPAAIQRRIERIVRGKIFNDYAQAAAAKMVTGLFTDSGRTWRKAAAENMIGKQMSKQLNETFTGYMAGILQRQIDYNVQLIRSLPLSVAQQMGDLIRSESMKGRRASEIAEDLQAKCKDLSRTRAVLIARTETSKVTTAITRSRSESIGIRWYVWRTSEDSRVRSSHEHMEGVLIPWDNPPSPELLAHSGNNVGHYHAGEVFNCRCYPEPVISLDVIPWPAKVYYGGQIVTMRRRDFARLIGAPE